MLPAEESHTGLTGIKNFFISGRTLPLRTKDKEVGMVESPSEGEMFDSTSLSLFFFGTEHNLLFAGTAAHLLQLSSLKETSRAQALCCPITKPIHNATGKHHTLKHSFIRLTNETPQSHPPQVPYGRPTATPFERGVRVRAGQWQDAVPLTLPQGTDCCCCLFASWLRAGVPHRSTRP